MNNCSTAGRRSDAALLRNEFMISGDPNAADSVPVEIIDDIYLPLVCER
jgi:hypothetical protein